MIKKLVTLIVIGRKLALSDALSIVSKIYLSWNPNKEGNIKGWQNLVSSFDGMAYAKEATKNVIADGLLDKTRSEGDWSSLRETFQEMEYDKKGQPLTDMEKEERELAERKKNKKAHGGLIDKPLSGGSRYI